ncbi:MAG: hypothetical protein H0W88_04345 [Parachlamydiaceae bacterium]|nr:hypothetical protein [Parachlamydiaceae bacterium]
MSQLISMLNGYSVIRPFVATASHGSELNYLSQDSDQTEVMQSRGSFPSFGTVEFSRVTTFCSDIFLISVESLIAGLRLHCYLSGIPFEKIMNLTNVFTHFRFGGHLLGALSSGHIVYEQQQNTHMLLRTILNICNLAPLTLKLFFNISHPPLWLAFGVIDLTLRINLWKRP